MNLRSTLYRRAKTVARRMGMAHPRWQRSSVRNLRNWIATYDRRAMPFLSQIRDYTRNYVIEARITLYNIKAMRDGVEIVDTITNPVFTISNVSGLTKQMIKQKLDTYIDTHTNNAYYLRITNTGEQAPMDLSPAGIYRNPIFMRVPDDIQYNITSTNNRRNYRFENLPIRNFDDPILCSIGINSEVWNTKKDECGINALLHQFQGCDRFKNMTRESIYDDIDLDEGDVITVSSIIKFCVMHDISVYIIGIGNKLEYKHISKNQNNEVFYFKIANDHLYPIDDEDLKKQIRYSVDNSVLIDIDWGNTTIFNFDKGNTRELFEFICHNSSLRVCDTLGSNDDSDRDYCGRKSRSDEVQQSSQAESVVFVKTYWNMEEDENDQRNLNDLSNYIYRKTKIIVENLRLDSNGNINSFSYKGCWVIFNSDYRKIQEILSIVRRLDVIKDKENYSFRNQNIQNITKSIIESYRGKIPQSNLSTKIYNLFKFYMRGAYNDTINSKISMDCKSFDISKCYTSIVYNREHNWGIFMPWDDLQPYEGGLVQGAKYIINKPDLQIGEIKLGNKLYDSEFVEKLLDNNFIDHSNITFELVPSKVLPYDYFKKLIDIIYNIIGNEKGYAKDMINLYIGTLGKHINKEISGEISTSLNHKKLWLSDSSLPDSNDSNKVKNITDDFMVLFSEEISICQTNNIPIFYGIVDMSYWKLYELQLMVCDEKSEVMKFHSDCITVKNPKKNVIGLYLYPNKRHNLGKIRSETLDYSVYSKCFVKSENFNTNNYDNTISPFDEMNVDDIDEIIKNKGSFALFGKPGRGKTYTTCSHLKNALDKYKYRYIGTSTSNKAVNNLRTNNLNSSTLCSLFMIRLGCSEEGMLREINSKYDYILCDEYTMNNLEYMKYLYTLHKMGTRIIFIGDKHQLPAVEKSNIVFNYRDLEFFREICDYKYIELKVNHRFDTELDSIITKIYDEGVFEMPEMIDSSALCAPADNNFVSPVIIQCESPKDEAQNHHNFFYEPDFEPDFDDIAIIADGSVVDTKSGNYGSYFKKTKYNICYHRKAKREINEIYMNENKNLECDKLIVRNNCYIKGSPVICKDNIKDGLFNNTLFNIVSWDDNNVILLNEKETEITITRELFQSKLKNRKGFTFEPGHAFTTHCAQGSTIQGDLCIWEADCMSRELLYTALSRATALSNIYIHNYSPLNDIRKENFSMVGDSANIEYLDRERKPFRGSLYEIFDNETKEALYVGSTKNSLEKRLEEHKEEIDKENITCKFHLHVKSNNITVGIKEISRVYFDDIRELYQAEYKAINQYIKNGIKIYNTKGIKLPKKRKLKVGEYKNKKNKTVGGCILVLHDRVRFRYSVNGKRKEKCFYTKKIGEARALKLAKEFQKSVYS